MNKKSLTIASFNVSMEATNYVGRAARNLSAQVLSQQLANNSQQIKNIAQIIQTITPDIILLNEFDYIDDASQGIECFIKQYLATSQGNCLTIEYPYYYYAPVNSGQPSPHDLTGDGSATGILGDAWGFGFFPGHYAMVLLSRYPIDVKNIRTFKNFKWADMPNALRPVKPDTGQFFYRDEIWQQFPLSSKSHWDVPVLIDNEIVHVLASHPTPPVFDGPELRNRCRNHDEVRFWSDYIANGAADYIYDDKGGYGGLAENCRFVIVGDLNASTTNGNSNPEAITALLSHDKVNDDCIPHSTGANKKSGAKSKASSNLIESTESTAKYHTAQWGMRADYVLPSRYGFKVIDNGVFWPNKHSTHYHLIKNRHSSSDHRLVWSQLQLTPVY